MSFTFNCPSCKQELEAENEWIGQETVCPSCNAKIIVPAPAEMTHDNSKSSEASFESARMEEKDHCPPIDNSETKEKTSTIKNENSNASENQNKKEDDCGGWGWGLAALAVIALVVWLAWLFVTGLPRLAFWLIAPIIGIVIYCYATKNKVVISILCCVILLWGWWAHTRDTNSSVNSSTTNSSATSQISTNSSNGLSMRELESLAVDEYNNENFEKAVKYARGPAEYMMNKINNREKLGLKDLYIAAMLVMARCYRDGKGGLPQDDKLFLEYAAVVDYLGYVKGTKDIADWYIQKATTCLMNGNRTEAEGFKAGAVKYWKKAARKGDKVSQQILKEFGETW